LPRFPLMALLSAYKNHHLIFQRRKIHEEDACNCVDGSNRAQLCGSGESGECLMLRFSRLLCLLQRVLTTRPGSSERGREMFGSRPLFPVQQH
jgi:hypothetical protein